MAAYCAKLAAAAGGSYQIQSMCQQSESEARDSLRAFRGVQCVKDELEAKRRVK